MQGVDYSTKQNARNENNHWLCLLHILKIRIIYYKNLYVIHASWPV